MSRHRFVVFLMVVWAMLFVRTVRAATLSEFMGGYESELLQWAAATALLGGMIRTILSLESDKRVVKDITKTAIWDAAKALIAGLMAFIVIQAVRSGGVLVPSEIRFTAVLVAGWCRMAAFDWLMNAGRDWMDARKAQFVGKPAAEAPDKSKEPTP